MKTPLKDSLLYKITTPGVILYSILTFSIGIGLAHHLGVNLDVPNMLLGFLLCVFLLEMRNLLNAYFEHPESAQSTISRGDAFFEQLGEIKRPLLLQVGLMVLTAGAMITVLLIFRGMLNPPTFFLLAIAFLICFTSALPPLRLQAKGYGELLEAVLIANMFPALAFTLQQEPPHILLVMLTIPLTLIYLSMKIARGFQGYGFADRHGVKTMLTMLGWQRGVTLHNLMILGAFLLIGVFMLIGLPWSLSWPLLLGLPLGLVQIYLISLLAEGDKPRWQLISSVAVGFFLLESYLVSLTLWIR